MTLLVNKSAPIPICDNANYTTLGHASDALLSNYVLYHDMPRSHASSSGPGLAIGEKQTILVTQTEQFGLISMLKLLTWFLCMGNFKTFSITSYQEELKNIHSSF